MLCSLLIVHNFFLNVLEFSIEKIVVFLFVEHVFLQSQVILLQHRVVLVNDISILIEDFVSQEFNLMMQSRRFILILTDYITSLCI